MAHSIEMQLLETTRLVLEPLVQRHAAALFAGLSDERLYAFMPIDPPEALEALEERLARFEKRRSDDGCEAWLNWAIRLREPAEYIGTFQATVRDGGEALLAYLVFTRFQRNGFAREAATEVVRFLFEQCGASQVEAQIDTRNTASLRLVESMGFIRTATVKNADYFKGAYSDEYWYTLMQCPARER